MISRVDSFQFTAKALLSPVGAYFCFQFLNEREGYFERGANKSFKTKTYYKNATVNALGFLRKNQHLYPLDFIVIVTSSL